ncbi:MAG: hypothetical protein IT184_16505 [Acidobacteria bacterium]|nr:hypothetical protein [Acidobacteriota bacterium]
MFHRLRAPLGLALALAAAAASSACGPAIDLTKISVTDTMTGWFDAGVKDGLNKLVPSVSFRLKNDGTVPATEIQLTIGFWREGDDGEMDGKEVRGLGSEPLQPGAASEPILVRADTGYTLEQPRSELFTHSMFKDVTARILAKRDGKIVRIGDVRIDRRIIPRLAASAAQ